MVALVTTVAGPERVSKKWQHTINLLQQEGFDAFCKHYGVEDNNDSKLDVDMVEDNDEGAAVADADEDAAGVDVVAAVTPTLGVKHERPPSIDVSAAFTYPSKQLKLEKSAMLYDATDFHFGVKLPWPCVTGLPKLPPTAGVLSDWEKLLPAFLPGYGRELSPSLTGSDSDDSGLVGDTKL